VEYTVHWGPYTGPIPLILLTPVGFIIYVIAATAETNRTPFDLPEAEQELIGGFLTEYSGLKFTMYYLAEYLNVITVSALATLLTGLKTTLTETFRPVVTTMYPEEKTPRSERYRGRHYLRRYDNGLERCIGCELCAAACPVGCILVIAAENTDENRVSPGERYAKTYEINMLRCIFCGYCEEACPVQAIVLGPEYE